MTPPRRKTVGYVAGLITSAALGVASHWVVPLAAPSGNAAQAATEESATEKRLKAIEQKQDAILSELRDVRETLAFVRGTLKLSGK